MLKVLLFIALGIVSTQAHANPSALINGDDKTVQFDTAFCGVVAENYARGELSDRGMKPHAVYSEVFAFNPGQIYSVLVKTEVYQDFLLVDGPEIGFNCFRCPNLKLVVSKENSKEACKNEQKL